MKITIKFDDCSFSHLRYCFEAARCLLARDSSQKKQEKLKEISDWIYNNKNIVLSVDSKEIPDMAGFAAALAKAVTLFVVDQKGTTNLEEILYIDEAEENKE